MGRICVEFAGLSLRQTNDRTIYCQLRRIWQRTSAAKMRTVTNIGNDQREITISVKFVVLSPIIAYIDLKEPAMADEKDKPQQPDKDKDKDRGKDRDRDDRPPQPDRRHGVIPEFREI
jgi:hypothetical protein